jgi:streptogramin lyase
VVHPGDLGQRRQDHQCRRRHRGQGGQGSGPFGITVAPNGDPWYTMMAANKIATLQLR